MLKLQAIGNIGKDAVLRKIEGSGAIAISFSVATNRRYKNAQNVDVEETTWIDCTLWRRPDQSTAIAEYLKAGVKVYVEGEPSTRAYVNSQQQATSALSLRVSTVELVGGQKAEPAPAAEKPKPGDLPASAFDNPENGLNADGKGGLPASTFETESGTEPTTTPRRAARTNQ